MGWHQLVAELVTERDMKPELNDVRAGRIYPWYVTDPGYWVHCEYCDFTEAMGAKGIR
jgi:hypothetical protein